MIAMGFGFKDLNKPESLLSFGNEHHRLARIIHNLISEHIVTVGCSILHVKPYFITGIKPSTFLLVLFQTTNYNFDNHK